MIIPRYPGGKTVFGNAVKQFFPAVIDSPPIYVEPFVGGGSMLMKVITERNFHEVIINDLDSGVICVYRCIQHNIDRLCSAIERVVPTVNFWRECKEVDNTGNGSLIDRAVAKIFLHAGSHGGLGAKAGSAQGGFSQTGKYKIDCRWNPRRIVTTLRRAHRLSSNWSVSSVDFALLEIDSHCFVYADPPYVKAGESLYKHSFSSLDHERLRDWIGKAGVAVVSYDYHDSIDKLYSNWNRSVVSMGSGNNPNVNKKELVIWKD